MVNIRCKCGRRLKVRDAMIGKAGHCPACQLPLRLVAPNYSETTAGGDDALLEVTAGPDRVGEIILLAGPGPIAVGRQPGIDLVLPGSGVSRTHCQLVRAGGGWRVVDMHSRGGIKVNGKRVMASDLHNGDDLRVGDYHLCYLSWTEAKLEQQEWVPPPFQSPEAAVPAFSVEFPSQTPPPLPAGSAERTEPQSSAFEGDGNEILDEEGLYELSDGETAEVARPEPSCITAPPPLPTGGPTCPSCKRSLAPSAKICVACGIDLRTGRAILTAQAHDYDTIYERAENWVRIISWIFWSGLYPIASEGFGLRQPYFTWFIAAITTVTSVLFLGYAVTDSPKMASLRNYMLWVGDAKPTAEELEWVYRDDSYGASAAFQTKYDELEEELATKLTKKFQKKGKTKEAVAAEVAEALEEAHDELVITAHESLTPEQQCFGHYAGYQLLTNAFLHGGLLHLAGNLVFLLVFGTRINAMIGNIAMAILYPVLAVCASIVYMATEQNSFPHPCLGNSGVVMGLAGMYLVLMPVHKVHMVWWYRLPWISLLRQAVFPLYYKIWAMRGFWVVLFYIGFDVLNVLLSSEDGVAHWAHLGGFIFGVAIGVLLLFTRLVNCRGADMVSALLGRHAWALVGKPDPNRKAPLEYGW